MEEAAGGPDHAKQPCAEFGLPAVVSCALDTSVGLAAGVHLAAALDDLPYACGLATGLLLADVPSPPAAMIERLMARLGRMSTVGSETPEAP